MKIFINGNSFVPYKHAGQNVNLDSLKNTFGFLIFDFNQPIDNPFGAGKWITVFTSTENNGGFQIAASTEPAIKIRSLNSGIWGDWKNITLGGVTSLLSHYVAFNDLEVA